MSTGTGTGAPVTAVSYATAAEVKAASPDIFSGTTHDTLLGTLVERASRLIDDVLGLEEEALSPSVTAAARYFDGNGDRYLHLPPFLSVTEVACKVQDTDTTYDDTWTADTDYVLAQGEPERPRWNEGWYDLLMVFPNSTKYFTPGAHTVKVTAVWGRTSSVPAEIKQAVIIQVTRWFKRGQSAFQDAVGMPELGTLLYTKKLDPDVQMILENSRYNRRTAW
jgi:hypothetical protein